MILEDAVVDEADVIPFILLTIDTKGADLGRVGGGVGGRRRASGHGIGGGLNVFRSCNVLPYINRAFALLECLCWSLLAQGNHDEEEEVGASRRPEGCHTP